MDRSSREVVRGIRYSPLPSQRKFHLSKARFKGFSGPVGSGKSQALCQEAIKLSYLNVGRVGLIGAPTYPMLRDATLTSFTEILRDNNLPFDYNKSESVLTMRDTKSRILFRAVDEFERLRGTNLAWFGVDELTYTMEEAWLRLEGRLRDKGAKELRGFAVWTPKGFDWVHKRFIREQIPGYDVVLAKPYENRFLLDVVPDFYDRLKHSYDERFFEQEVLGSYLNVNSGAVYSSFDRARNVKPVEMDKRLPLFWTLDFNVDPMSSLVVQAQGGELVVLDEIVLHRASTMDACLEFQRRFPNHQAGVIVFGDASGSKLQTAGTSDYRIVRDFLKENGYEHVSFRVPAANPFVRERIQLTNTMLLPGNETAGLTVSPKCRELIADFEEVVYKANSTSVDKDRDPKRTHLSDALGYLIWQEYRSGPKRGEQSKRLYW